MSSHLTLSIAICFAASGNEDCLWYVDKNGTWHNGFDCPLITFCCGNCHRRYCCLDAFKMITEREQKRCMLFQFRWGRGRRRRQQQGFNLITYLLIYTTPRVCIRVHNSRLSLWDHILLIFLKADGYLNILLEEICCQKTAQKNNLPLRCVLNEEEI